MICLISPLDYAANLHDLQEMYKLRCNYFYNHLKWDVKIQNEMEKDEYDELYTYYIIYKNQHGIIKGCVRLIEMINECMFDGPFDFLLDNLESFKKPGYWEISRFAIDPKCGEEEFKEIFTSLITALSHFGLQDRPIKTYLALSYPISVELAKNLGIQAKIIKEDTIKNETVIVSFFTPDVETHKMLLQKFDISVMGSN